MTAPRMIVLRISMEDSGESTLHKIKPEKQKGFVIKRALFSLIVLSVLLFPCIVSSGGVGEVGAIKEKEFRGGLVEREIGGFVPDLGVSNTYSDEGSFTVGHVWSINKPTIPSKRDFSLLLLSLLILIFGLFFLSQVVKIQKWAFKDEEEAPNPESGVESSWIIALIIICAWYFRTVLTIREPGISFHPIYYIPENEWFTYLIFDFFYFNPKEYAPGFLLASFYPIAVGLFKCITIAVSTPLSRSRGASRFAWTPLFYTIIGFINFTASIVTLYKANQP